jgi:hypothetical protein
MKKISLIGLFIIGGILTFGLNSARGGKMQLILELQGPPTWRYAIANNDNYTVTMVTLDHKASGTPYSAERPDGWDIVQADSRNVGWMIRDPNGAGGVAPGGYLSGFEVTFRPEAQNSQEGGWAVTGFNEEADPQVKAEAGLILVPSL